MKSRHAIRLLLLVTAVCTFACSRHEPATDAAPAPAASPAEESTAPAAEPTPDGAAAVSVSGRVYDEDTGDGIANTTLNLNARFLTGTVVDGRFHVPTPIATTTTAADGTYAFEGLRAGRYTVMRSTTPHYTAEGQNQALDIELRENEPLSDADFPVTVGFTAPGHITDAQGNPIADAEILAVQEDTRQPVWPWQHQRSNRNGDFTLIGLTPGGNLGLVIDAPNCLRLDTSKLTENRRVRIGDNLRNDLQIVLQPGAQIRGRVTDREGDPLKDAMIGVEKGDIRARISESGVFKLEGLPFAPQKLRVWLPDSLDQAWLSRESAPVDLSNGSVDGITIRAFTSDGYKMAKLAGSAITTGYFLDDYAHPVGRLMFYYQAGDGKEESFTTDKQGFFALDLGTQRKLRLHLASGSKDTLPAASFDNIQAGSRNSRFTLTPAALHAISVIVLAADTGAPIRRFSIEQRMEKPRTFADAQGRFTMPGSNQGPLGLTISAPGYIPKAVNPPALGKDARPVTIKLDPAQGIRGIVVDEFENPIPNATIKAAKFSSGETGANGLFELKGLPPGRPLKATVAAPGFAGYVTPLNAGANSPNEMRFVMQHAGALHVSLANPTATDSKTAIRATVELAFPAANLQYTGVPQTMPVDNLQGATFQNLPPGDFQLKIEVNRKPYGEPHAVTITSGAIAEFQIE